MNETLRYVSYGTLQQLKLRINNSRTTILGYNFSAPIFIAPAARGVYGHERAELNFVEGAASEDILYSVGTSYIEPIKKPLD